MAIRTIRELGEDVLRKQSKPVDKMTIRTRILINDMLDTMYEAMGVGLAAPQVGILKQIVVIDIGEGPVVLINPEIIETSGEQTGDEGCLSVPGKAGKVTRPNYAKVKALNEDISELDDIENNLEFLKEEKAILEKEFKLINSTKDFLKEANDSLTSKYISPMYEGLMKFLKLSTTEELEKINLNTELKVSFESQGALRELSYMSEGYQTIVNLALRLALVETIFTTEKPFIVLDDPFVNLDEEKDIMIFDSLGNVFSQVEKALGL